jgi:hypothetical protein
LGLDPGARVTEMTDLARIFYLTVIGTTNGT